MKDSNLNRETFTEEVVKTVQEYIDYSPELGDNPQLCINPRGLSANLVDGRVMMDNISESNSAVEQAAFVDGDESESSTDFQASEDPEFYSLALLVHTDVTGARSVNMKEVERLVSNYFTE